MTRLSKSYLTDWLNTSRFLLIAVIIFASGVSCSGQSSSGGSTGASQSQASASAAPGQDSSSAVTVTDPKKKKVWTNEEVGSLGGPVSVVGNDKKGDGKNATKGQAKPAAQGNTDTQYVASTKKELQKLQAQLDDTEKQITAFKDFSQGKAPEPVGYEISKGYTRVPVDQQIVILENKKKQLEDKIDALVEEARKKGVLPGQLR